MKCVIFLLTLCKSSVHTAIFIFYLFYFWLCRVFIAACWLSLLAEVRGYSLTAGSAGFSLQWPLSLQSTGSRHTGSVVVMQRLSCCVVCRIFPDQGSNSYPLHWPDGFLSTGPPGKSTHVIPNLLAKGKMNYNLKKTSLLTNFSYNSLE